jgi:hypothetical protein
MEKMTSSSVVISACCGLIAATAMSGTKISRKNGISRQAGK